ncbi:hypothetical protein [Nonomuraea sp. NPDC003804]|uniref:hypothetical protein n=1 Tax=Nonomuraea sp. NPDC003804 TaxID=3154547 RepID=UPI00339E525B
MIRVQATTDGAFLSKQRITQRIVELGIDAVSVSLDSADAVYDDTWPPPLNKRDGWQRVVDGVRTLPTARDPSIGPRVGLYTVVTRLNLPDIVAIPRLAAELGCDYAVPQPVSLDDDHALSPTLALTRQELPELRSQFERLYAADLAGVRLPAADYPGRVAAASERPTALVRGCFSGHTQFFIEPDGSVWDCPSSLGPRPDRHRSTRSPRRGDRRHVGG